MDRLAELIFIELTGHKYTNPEDIEEIAKLWRVFAEGGVQKGDDNAAAKKLAERIAGKLRAARKQQNPE
ncbi:MAG: hypothetical protein AAF583_01710 [Pseudomonadota bacterium]